MSVLPMIHAIYVLILMKCDQITRWSKLSEKYSLQSRSNCSYSPKQLLLNTNIKILDTYKYNKVIDVQYVYTHYILYVCILILLCRYKHTVYQLFLQRLFVFYKLLLLTGKRVGELWFKNLISCILYLTLGTWFFHHYIFIHWLYFSNST